MTAINLPSVIYPKYSEHYFKQKNIIKARLETEMQDLSDFQPFYEKTVAVLSKYNYIRPVEMRAYTTSIQWSIRLTYDDRLSLLEPMLKELYSAFDKPVEEPTTIDWDTYVFWIIYQSRQKPDGKYTPPMSCTLKVWYPEGGLKDMPVKTDQRVTTTSMYVPEFTQPFWRND